MALATEINENREEIFRRLGGSSDLKTRLLRIGADRGLPMLLVYLDGLADSERIKDLIDSLLRQGHSLILECNVMTEVQERMLTTADVEQVDEMDKLIGMLLTGHTILLTNHCPYALAAGTGHVAKRSVKEPTSQTVIKGPQEGFVESVQTNVALMRKRLPDERLHVDTRTIGRITRTKVSVLHLEGIADKTVLQEVHRRLQRIDIDGVLESNYIEEFIQDVKYSPFPVMFNTERPDVAAAGLLEGKVAIVTDGSPFVLLVPITFLHFYHSAEDYYQRTDLGFIRILRLFASFLSLLGPALYIAISTFHQELIPATLLIGLSAQREGVPFPAFVEALEMEIIFEILHEAGIRMPKAVGQAVSIVGAIVIGQAAVEAGLVSSAMVIVVSLTAIANFALPDYNAALGVRLLRFGFMILAASFGLFGVTIGLIAFLFHLCSLESFGAPFMGPFAPFQWQDLKDSFFRVQWWAMKQRPVSEEAHNLKRLGETGPTGGDEG